MATVTLRDLYLPGGGRRASRPERSEDTSMEDRISEESLIDATLGDLTRSSMDAVYDVTPIGAGRIFATDGGRLLDSLGDLRMPSFAKLSRFSLTDGKFLWGPRTRVSSPSSSSSS
jgi:hypothetical protein